MTSVIFLGLLYLLSVLRSSVNIIYDFRIVHVEVPESHSGKVYLFYNFDPNFFNPAQ